MTEAVPTPPADLDALRAEIDRIDGALLDLLDERGRVVREIGRRKSPGSPMRPARQAVIARRVAERASGGLPNGFLIGLWSEIISAYTHMQSPVAIAVCAPSGQDDDSGAIALARDYFGRFAKLTRVEAPARALSLVSSGDATAALLPPVWGAGDERPWWPEVLGAGAAGDPLRVIGLLPFSDRPVGRPFPEMMLVGAAPIAPSGDDRSLVAVQFAEPVSRDRQNALLSGVGLPPVAMTQFRPGGGVRDLGDLAIILIETPDYVEEDDPRFAELTAAAGGMIDWVRRAGAYPAPLRKAA